MKSGTRRMWSRRVLRAGWLIAPIFSFPKRTYRHLFCNRDGKIKGDNVALFIFFSVVVSIFGYLFYYIATEHNPASPTKIASVMKDDVCLADLIPRRAADKGSEPLTNRDIEIAQRDCKKASDDYYAVLEQQKVLKAQSAVMGETK